jgi:broad specificity phosphatase PhoE
MSKQEPTVSRRFFVLRHGETHFNVEQKLQGHCNSPLTPKGRAQARAVGTALKAYLGPEFHFYASSLGRAVQTAEIVRAALGCAETSIIKEPRLMEFALGLWEQRTVPSIKSQHPELAGAGDWYLHAPEAESFDEVRSRLASWLAELPPQGDIVVVSHALTGIALRGMLLDLSYEDCWRQDLPQDAFFIIAQGRVTRIDCTLDVARELGVA